MRLKSELYKKEQEDIMNKIINILELDDDHSTTLYEMDNNLEMQNKITTLIPDIKKYFSSSYIDGIKAPSRIKRPYLSIIKHIVKLKYNIYNSDCRIIVDGKKIRTTRYVFIPKNT